jgi:hypothetical protein
MALTLKRTSKHRSGGPWSHDDYDVSDGERHVRRILLTHAASRETPWFLDDHGAREYASRV